MSPRADYTGTGVILSYDSRTISLNRSARWIWELCDGSLTAEQITEILERRLGLPSRSLAPEVAASIDQLTSLGLLRGDVEAAGAAGSEAAVDASSDPESQDGVDWRRLAEPQEDGYDTRVIQAHAARRGRAILRAAPGDRFFDGVIAIAWCYPDDVEPGLVNAPRNHPSLAEAERYVRSWPVAHRQLRDLVGTVHPLIDPRLPVGAEAFQHPSRAYAVEALPGTLYSSVNCPVKLAFNLVHEMAHQKLFELGVYINGADRLVRNAPQQLYHSPFKDRERPMPAILHGVFAFAHVMQLTVRMIEAMTRGELVLPPGVDLLARLDRDACRIEEGVSQLQAHAAADRAGAAFLAGLYHWATRLDQVRRRLVA